LFLCILKNLPIPTYNIDFTSTNNGMMTPLEEASLLQALQLTGTETVLEVGTGSGFLTAMFKPLCKKVISIVTFKEFNRFKLNAIS